MTTPAKFTATIFIIVGFIITAFCGYLGNLLGMGGWLLATVFVVAMCINAEDRMDRKYGRLDARDGLPLIDDDAAERTIDWNRAALQISREKRRS
jgi:hypothetical protein